METPGLGLTGTLATGHCDGIKTATKYMRMVFAAITTLVLAAASYTAQVLTAPSRSEIDTAHSRRRALELGVLSFRNLRFVSKRGVFMAGVALLCGLSVGTLYNTAFFPVYQSRDYNVALVNEAFVHSTPNYKDIQKKLQPWPRRWQSDKDTITITWAEYSTISRRNNDWRILSPQECINIYAADYQSEYRHVLAVTKDSSPHPTLIHFHSQITRPATRQHDWLCPHKSFAFDRSYYSCSPWTIPPHDWRIGEHDHRITYCLAEKPSTIACTISYSRTPLLALTLSLATLSIIMAAAALSHRPPPILTVGDAIASFLEDPDPHTEGMCTYTAADFTPVIPLPHAVVPRGWNDERRRVGAAVRYGDWAVFYWMLGAAMAAVVVVWVVVLREHDGEYMDLSLGSQYRMGLGEVNQVSVVEGLPWLLVGGPQVGVGLAWMGYMRLVGVMEFAKEYNGYAFRRGGLWTSGVVKGCRWRWWGVVPPRMMVVVAAVGWAVSAAVGSALFVVRVDFRGVDGGVKRGGRFYGGGWSTPGVEVVFVVVAVAVGVQLWMAAKKVWRSAPPNAGVCSAAVAAACHDGGGYEGVGEMMVMWGSQRVYREGRHLGFSRGRVERPVRWGRTRGERGEMTRIVLYS